MFTTKEVRKVVRDEMHKRGTTAYHTWTDIAHNSNDATKRYVGWSGVSKKDGYDITAAANARLGSNVVRTNGQYIRATAVIG